MENLDEKKVKKTIIIIIFMVLITILAIFFYIHDSQAHAKKTCEQNPTLRYQQPCNNYNECLSLCIKQQHTNTTT